MTFFKRQDIVDLISRATDMLPTQSVMRGCLVACTFFLILRWLTWKGSVWSDRQATVIAFCLSVLLHLCFWMGCTVLTESGMGYGEPGMTVAAVEEPVPIRQFLEEGESQPGPSSQSSSSGQGRAVWDKVMTSSAVSYERNRPDESVVPESTEVPQRQVAPSEPVRSELPDLPIDETPLVVDRPPEMLASRASATRAPAAVDVDAIETPTAEPVSESRPDAKPAIRRFERTNQFSASKQRPSAPPSGPEQPQRKTATNRGTVAVGGDLMSSLKNPSGMSAAARDDFSESNSDAPGDGKPRRSASREGSPRSGTGGVLDRNKVALPANSVQTVLSGIVTDVETGRPLASAFIRIDRANHEPLSTQTGSNGLYRLAMTELPDNVAVTVVRKGYLPESRNLGNKSSRLDFALSPIDESIISVEQKPEVHHLGNDVFSGDANSQFQRKTEGPRWTATFSFTPNQLQFKPKSVSLSMLAKGMQYPAKLRINGLLLAQPSQLSPSDGSFGTCELRFVPYLLKAGENEISIEAAERNGDQDDFEFVNVQLRFLRKE